MKKNKVAKLVGLAVVVMLFSPAIASAFGGKELNDDVKGDPSFRPPIPRFMVHQYDTDADGQLSQQERETAHAEILEEYDTDGDGKLSRKERRAVRDAAHDAFVAKYDTDGDQKISAEERDAIKADLIAQYDKDGDEALSKDELPWGGPGGRHGLGGRGGRGGPRR